MQGINKEAKIDICRNQCQKANIQKENRGKKWHFWHQVGVVLLFGTG
jgi:hypothetical protein